MTARSPFRCTAVLGLGALGVVLAAAPASAADGLGGLTDPVLGTVATVTTTVGTVADPLTTPLQPVLDPVVEAVKPVAAPLPEPVKDVTAGAVTNLTGGGSSAPGQPPAVPAPGGAVGGPTTPTTPTTPTSPSKPGTAPTSPTTSAPAPGQPSGGGTTAPGAPASGPGTAPAGGVGGRGTAVLPGLSPVGLDGLTGVGTASDPMSLFGAPQVADAPLAAGVPAPQTFAPVRDLLPVEAPELPDALPGLLVAVAFGLVAAAGGAQVAELRARSLRIA